MVVGNVKKIQKYIHVLRSVCLRMCIFVCVSVTQRYIFLFFSFAIRFLAGFLCSSPFSLFFFIFEFLYYSRNNNSLEIQNIPLKGLSFSIAFTVTVFFIVKIFKKRHHIDICYVGAHRCELNLKKEEMSYGAAVVFVETLGIQPSAQENLFRVLRRPEYKNTSRYKCCYVISGNRSSKFRLTAFRKRERNFAACRNFLKTSYIAYQFNNFMHATSSASNRTSRFRLLFFFSLSFAPRICMGRWISRLKLQTHTTLEFLCNRNSFFNIFFLEVRK